MVGKVILIIVLIIVGLAGIMLIFATRGLKKVKTLPVEDIDFSTIPDGVYSGSFTGYRWSNTVKVTVQDGRVTDFEVVEEKMQGGEAIADGVREKLLSQQNLSIDTVSGASVNTRAYLKAIEGALKKAKQ